MVWQKGQSGNPRGRRSKRAVNGQEKRLIRLTAREQAERHVGEAFRTLSEVMRDKSAPHSARVSAASTLLDRAYGRAPQDVTIKGAIEQHIIALVTGLDGLERPSGGNPADARPVIDLEPNGAPAAVLEPAKPESV